MSDHVPPVKDWKINRIRGSTEKLRGNCTTGYMFTVGDQAKGQSEYHHILPIESLQDGSIEPQAKLEFLQCCLAITEWDIDKGDNLIGMPTKGVYEAADRKANKTDMEGAGTDANPFRSRLRELAAQVGFFGTLPDIPCHENAHNLYNVEVIKYLCKKIWQPLAKEKEDCNVSPKSVAGQLDSASKHWRDFLVNRGTSNRGAAHCWVHRHDPGYDAFWYIPFSMNPGKPRKAKAPPRLPPTKQADWLKNLFNLV